MLRRIDTSDGVRLRLAIRSGFNITELLFALTAISALSVLAMTVIGLLINAEQRSAEGLWIDTIIADLATTLREDAHAATDVELEQTENGRSEKVAFTSSPGSQIIYECTDDSVIRREMDSEEQWHRETYRLAFGTSWFERTADGQLEFHHERAITSHSGLTDPSPDIVTPQRRYEVLATIGLHASLAPESGQ